MTSAGLLPLPSRGEGCCERPPLGPPRSAGSPVLRCLSEAGVCSSTWGSRLQRPGWGVAAWGTGGGQAPCQGLQLGKGPHHHHQAPAGHRTKLRAEPGCRGAEDPRRAGLNSMYVGLATWSCPCLRCQQPARHRADISTVHCLGLQHRLHPPASTSGLACLQEQHVWAWQPGRATASVCRHKA